MDAGAIRLSSGLADESDETDETSMILAATFGVGNDLPQGTMCVKTATMGWDGTLTVSAPPMIARFHKRRMTNAH